MALCLLLGGMECNDDMNQTTFFFCLLFGGEWKDDWGEIIFFLGLIWEYDPVFPNHMETHYLLLKYFSPKGLYIPYSDLNILYDQHIAL